MVYAEYVEFAFSGKKNDLLALLATISLDNREKAILVLICCDVRAGKLNRDTAEQRLANFYRSSH